MNVLGMLTALMFGIVACVVSFVLGVGVAAHHLRSEAVEPPIKKSRPIDNTNA